MDFTSHYYDMTAKMLENREFPAAMQALVGQLYALHAHDGAWEASREKFRQHRVYDLLLRDPFVRHSCSRPRGYAGDAQLIDLIYDCAAPSDTCADGLAMFDISIRSNSCVAVRERRELGQRRLLEALEQGQSVLVLACGHFREADGLSADQLGAVTLVDQDSQSLARVRRVHGPAARIIEGNVIHMLRGAARDGEQWDYVYTLGLTDYFDDRAMRLFHRLLAAVLAPGGRALVANFLPHHLYVGWMDAVMDWQLICRDENALIGFATDAGLEARGWRDAYDIIAYCEMNRP